MTFGKTLAAVVLICSFALPANADDSTSPLPKNPFPQLEETAKQFLTMLEYLVLAIPQYEAPTIMENGDIIIRRKRPENEQKDPIQPREDAPSGQRKI